MRQLVFVEPGRLEWQEAPAPALLEETDALVRPVAVATCDLDAALMAGATPVSGPFAMGHEGVAEVVETGPAVVSVRTGQRVIVPFQLSCGACERCRRGLTGSCTVAGPGAMYGFEPFGGSWGGFLADLVRVPWADAMLLPLPEGVDPVAFASMSDNIPDGWRTVAPYLAQQPHAPVLVVGGGAPGVPLYAVAIAGALGAERVDYVDHDADRLARAERLGANPIEGPHGRRAGRYPITVDASADPKGLAFALRSTEPGGTCTSIGIYWNDVAVPLLEMYTSGVVFVTGRVNDRATIPHVLELVTRGLLHPEAVTDRIVDWDDAAEALAHHRTKTVVRRGS